MKTILVTGGAGFIGSNFIKYILNKYPEYKILVLDTLTYAGSVENFPPSFMNHDRFNFWYGDVRNGELVDTLVSQSDIVIHFAAETHVTRSIYDNWLFFETDVLGTQAVANAVLKYSSRIEKFIHISTSEVYGTARSEIMDEEHLLMPMSPYSSAKAGADRLVYSYYVTYDLPIVIIRPFNNYGHFQHLEKLIPRFITSCILDDVLTVHGDGTASRDWVYVEDHCEALDKVLHADINKIKGEVINIGSGRTIDIKTIAMMIVDRMKKPENYIKYTDDRLGQVFKHISSTEKAKKLLDWNTKTSFEEGLDKTIKWYIDNRSWWEKQMWMRTIPIVTREGIRKRH